MRTDSFSKEKHLPVRRFIADESKVATGLYGPRAIADDLDNIFNMFDPDASFLGGDEQGGISSKNLQNGAVTYEKLADDVTEKLQGIATEVQLQSLRAELTEKTDAKADQSDTFTKSEVHTMHTALQVRISMAEQAIETKATTGDLEFGLERKADKSTTYTKEEVDNEIRKVSDDIVEYAEEIDTRLSEQLQESQQSIAKKTEETVLYEDVVNTPEWTNQPSYEGTLDFDTSDYYYVTLKDTDGTALPSGQFKLMPLYDKYAEAYETVFTLADLKTGNDGVITENLPVEFTTDYKMRTAGVGRVAVTLNLPMDSNLGKLTIRTTGQFIKELKGGYFASNFLASSGVAHYHSAGVSTGNSDNDKAIWHFVNNQGDDYKIGKFVDVFTLQMNGEKSFVSNRNSLLRYQGYGTNTYKNITDNSVGFGFILSENTKISSVSSYAVKNGYIRNGSVICVTEVK